MSGTLQQRKAALGSKAIATSSANVNKESHCHLHLLSDVDALCLTVQSAGEPLDSLGSPLRGAG